MAKRTWEEQMRVDQQMRYDDFNTVQIKLKLNKKTDEDILRWVAQVKQTWMKKDTSLQGEIKRLIRQEITTKNQ